MSATVQQGRFFVIFHGAGAHEAYNAAERFMSDFSPAPTRIDAAPV